MTRYYGALLDGLADRGVEVVIPLLASGCDYQTSLSGRLKGLKSIPKVTPLLDKLSNFLFRRKVLTGDYDLVLLTDPDYGRKWRMARRDVRFVMVVHDLMSCIVAPDGLYDSAGPALVNLLYLTRRAAGVICISDDTRQALMAMAPLEEERVAVIRTGNLFASSSPAAASLELPERFLLFVGERSGRKGFYVFARAFRAIREQYPDVWIVCTGRLSEAEEDLLERFGIADRVKAIPAPDSTLKALYQRAVCLVYPSLYEGFGLPPIEAMYYGCPVLTTGRGALSEICSDAAIVVDPDQPAQLGEWIERILAEPAILEEYRQRGRAWSAAFSTGKMMDEFANYLNNVARPSSNHRVSSQPIPPPFSG